MVGPIGLHSAKSADLLDFLLGAKSADFIAHLVLPEYQLILLLGSR
jgi:hypothetical protein